jgi:hypothetical protein
MAAAIRVATILVAGATRRLAAMARQLLPLPLGQSSSQQI